MFQSLHQTGLRTWKQGFPLNDEIYRVEESAIDIDQIEDVGIQSSKITIELVVFVASWCSNI